MSRTLRFRVPAVLSLAVTATVIAGADAQLFPGVANPYTGPAGVPAGPAGGVGSPYMPPGRGEEVPRATLSPYFGPSGSLDNTPSQANSPYYNPGPGYFYAQPLGIDFSGGGYLRGAADVINAQGRYLLTRQEAFSAREAARQAQIETRRMLFDELLRERELTPTPEDMRQRVQEELLTRSLNNPPISDVVSARALNSILASIQNKPRDRQNGEPVPLDPSIVGRVNLTKGDRGGNLGLLREEGRLNWPRGMKDLQPAEPAKAVRDGISAKTQEAYNQARSGGEVSPELIRQLEADSRELNRMLADNVRDLSFTEYSDAKAFLANLDSAIRLLGDPDAAEFLGGEYAPRVSTVDDLVRHMTQKGLRFAPAVNEGEKAAYSSLHQSLVRYYNTAK